MFRIRFSFFLSLSNCEKVVENEQNEVENFSFNHFSRQLETGFLLFRVVKESLFFISFQP